MNFVGPLYYAPLGWTESLFKMLCLPVLLFN